MELVDFWFLATKLFPTIASHKKQEGGTECDVFCFLREAETVGLGKMS